MSVQISGARTRSAPTLLDDLIGVVLGCYDAELARWAGGRALFDHLACLRAGQRRAPDGIGDAGAAALLDLDDIHWPSTTHIGAIVWTVLRRIGVDRDLRWRAAHAGYEVTARLGAALGPDHRRHWHVTATAGTVGGAVAAAIALGSDPVNAAGHAVSVAGGSIVCILERTPTRVVHRDHAADAALRCAGVAKLTPAHDGLEHPQGMFAAMGGAADRLLAPVAEPAIAAVSFRRHLTSGFCQAAVEAAAELAPVSPDSDVSLELPAATVALASIPRPGDREEAWWSCQHAVAVTLLGLELGACAVDDPRVVALRDRITVRVGDHSRVTADGRVAERAVAAALSDDDLRAKWRRLNPAEPAPEELLT